MDLQKKGEADARRSPEYQSERRQYHNWQTGSQCKFQLERHTDKQSLGQPFQKAVLIFI